MISKDYYRVDELIADGILTNHDMVYLWEDKKLHFVLPQSSNKCLIGAYEKPDRFVGMGVAFYEGLVRLKRDYEKSLLHKGEVSAKGCFIIQPEKLNIVSQNYPFTLPIPNNLVFRWSERVVTNRDLKVFAAYKYPSQQKHPVQMIADTLNQFAALDSKQQSNPLPDQLSVPYVKYRREDLCILKSTLIKLGLLGGPILEGTKDSNNPSRISQLDELLDSIIRAHPKMSAKEYWRLIKKECLFDEGERMFDVENILRDVSDTEIYWVSRYGNGQFLKISTFDGKISKARKRLGIFRK